MKSGQALKAVKRFGLGAKPGELVAASADPQGFVLRQLETRDFLNVGNDLPASDEAWREFRRYRRERKKQAKAEVKMREGQPQNYVAETMARVTAGIETDSPFLERLALFWSNHFCVSSRKAVIRVMAGAYEREAIRPHLLGRFRDMLHAVVRHPAMLLYLDNARSIGPNSSAGKGKEKGLNENLARELLELHTVGVGAGYSQADVTSFAKALTGWTYRGKGPKGGVFYFDADRHEPGAVAVMGRRYVEGGADQAEAILDDLARKPATARHVALKLARHFVGERAPAALVERLARTFADTDGDLLAVTRTLVSAHEAWTPEPAKILPPYDLLVSAFRTTQTVPGGNFVKRTLATFGQPMWAVESPAGWPDRDLAWALPDALLERVDWADQVATEVGESGLRDVPALAREAFGPSISVATREAVARAESRSQALALLLLSPEFQRR